MKTFQMSFKNDKWSDSFPIDFDSADTILFAYFSSSLHGNPLWKNLKASFPKSKIMGCSGAGEVRQSEICEGEVILSGIKFEKAKIQMASITDIKGKSSEDIGQALGSLLPKKDLVGVYLLSDGLSVNGTGLIKGLKFSLGEKLNLSGGLAGDGTDFKNTYVLIDGEPRVEAVTALGFYGSDINVVSYALGGWTPFGPVRTITKSSANVLYELDGKPALKLYEEFLGNQAAKLPASALIFPLHLRSGNDNKERNAVRTILAIDQASQSMTFAGDVPEGTSTQLMRAGHENLIEAAKNTALVSAAKLDKSLNTLSLVVSCVGRRLVLGENCETELEQVLENLPAKTLQTGFYSYGEVAAGESGFCDLHNQTMTITLIQEMI